MALSLTSCAPSEHTSAVNVASFVSSALRRDENNSSNYKSWKEQMLCLIESQGLLAFIDGAAPPPPVDGQDYAAWRRTDRLIKGWILGALSDSVAETVVNCNSAMDVWLKLENSFSAPKRAAPAEQGTNHALLESLSSLFTVLVVSVFIFIFCQFMQTILLLFYKYKTFKKLKSMIIEMQIGSRYFFVVHVEKLKPQKIIVNLFFPIIYTMLNIN